MHWCAQRRARDASQAFRRMLASKRPPITPQTTYTEIIETFGQDPRYIAVPDEERKAIMASYLDSLVAAQQHAQEVAEKRMQRQARDASQAFRRMLATKKPPITPQTTYTEIIEAFGQDPRYIAVPDEERRAIVASYLDSLVHAQEHAQEVAQKRLKDLYAQLAGPTSHYEEIAPQVAANPVVQAVPDEILRAALFLEVVQGLQAEQKVSYWAVLSVVMQGLVEWLAR
ncbi:hypothetical protein DUNSADRAFT_11775 [Dunaliella salina]|uniref:FF domain-containing protein n=1 Tax=Dunaliella salina TaxID=3046 RepID=A0ABQ7GCM4_DUNSA|nr:hypothetical protein DUNSADRAFT_11775 [Dunaliella salina]|eukprot:KAF5832365.1 hypothetical protein DUNSADRAFT_11775 [Dunaliella salina]